MIKNILLFFVLTLPLSSLAGPAIYEVPVEAPALKAFSSFIVQDIVLTADQLSFTLPAEIASPQVQKIVFTSTDATHFSSNLGSAICLNENENIVQCQIKYNEKYQTFLKNNLEATESFLSKISTNELDLSNRIEIARTFAGDPIGILSIVRP